MFLWWQERYQEIEEACSHREGQKEEAPRPRVHVRNEFQCKPGQA